MWGQCSRTAQSNAKTGIQARSAMKPDRYNHSANTANRPAALNAKPSATRRSETGRRSGGWVPYKPALQHLVDGKQEWAQPISPQARGEGFMGWHQRGYLPHRDTPGLIQFVTFRMQDGLPSTRRTEWKALLELEDNRERRTRLEEYLDRGYGHCWLSQAAVATLAEGALRHFHGERYQLLA